MAATALGKSLAPVYYEYISSCAVYISAELKRRKCYVTTKCKYTYYVNENSCPFAVEPAAFSNEHSDIYVLAILIMFIHPATTIRCVKTANCFFCLHQPRAIYSFSFGADQKSEAKE